MELAKKDVTSAEKDLADAKEDLTDANKDLGIAEEANLKDIEKYRKGIAEKIKANDQSLINLKARIEESNSNKEIKEDYKGKVTALEQKNKEMQDRMDTYKLEAEDKWEKFKSDFIRDMEELDKSFKDLKAKNESEKPE
jgi:chromosome segregation ATPase